MYNDTVTLFNRKEGDEGDTWYPTVLRNVQVDTDRAAIVAKYGAESADSAFLIVPYKVSGNDKLVAGKPWKPPKEWERQLNHNEAITFTPGNRFDFFWVGEWENEDPVYDSDYTGTSSAGFYNHMNKNYDFVFAISSVGGPNSVNGLLPHFEIIGK